MKKLVIALMLVVCLSGVANARGFRADAIGVTPEGCALEERLLQGEDCGMEYIRMTRGIDVRRNGVTLKTMAEATPTTVRGFKVKLTEAGTLAEKIAGKFEEIDSLVVEGPINMDDFDAIWQCSWDGSLRILNLEKAEIAGGVIPDMALYHSTEQFYGPGFPQFLDIRRIILPEGITEIGDLAFARMRLEQINLPSSLRKLGKASFMSCHWLKTTPLRIPDGVEEIPYMCFAHVQCCDRIELPPSVKKVGQWAFYNTRFIEVGLSEGLEMVDELGFYGSDWLEELVLPNSCVDLRRSAFGQLFKLKRLELPENMMSLGPNCFETCLTLEEVRIPKYYAVGEYAFTQCEALRKVDFDGVALIHQGAFQYCAIDSLILPSSITAIGKDAFEDNAIKVICSLNPVPPVHSPKMVNALASTIESDGITPFEGCSVDIPVYVPRGAGEAYRSAALWSKFTNIIETDDFPLAGIGTLAPVNDCEVSAGQGCVVIKAGSLRSVPYRIHAVNGATVASGVAECQSTIELPSGIYVVRCGCNTVKVLVK